MENILILVLSLALPMSASANSFGSVMAQIFDHPVLGHGHVALAMMVMSCILGMMRGGIYGLSLWPGLLWTAIFSIGATACAMGLTYEKGFSIELAANWIFWLGVYGLAFGSQYLTWFIGAVCSYGFARRKK